eukprot:187832_1
MNEEAHLSCFCESSEIAEHFHEVECAYCPHYAKNWLHMECMGISYSSIAEDKELFKNWEWQCLECQQIRHSIFNDQNKLLVQCNKVLVWCTGIKNYNTSNLNKLDLVLDDIR